MNDFTHTGRIIFEGGRQAEVTLKVSGQHWIDENCNRWQGRTGAKTNNNGQKYPHLMTHSVRKLPSSKRTTHRFTHQGRVRGKAGKGAIVDLRETPYYWIDKNEVRYKKKEFGWRMDGVYKQLVLDSIVPMAKVKGAPVGPQRSLGKNEVVEV